MSKKLCVIQSPVGTFSGYGERSRDLIRAFIKEYDSDFEVELIPTVWGSTPWDALSEDRDRDLIYRLTSRFQPFHHYPVQPDLFIQITVPNEFISPGKVNIGVTAAIETDTCHPDFIRGCNRMDLVLVSSQHSKEVLEKGALDLNTKEYVKLTTPVKVLFEGVKVEIFDKKYSADLIKRGLLQEQFKKLGNFNFLFVGHWLKGVLGQDRKDVGMLVKCFYEAFKNRKNPPGLILKTSAGNNSLLDLNAVVGRIQEVKSTVEARTLPPVHIIHGELTPEEMNVLYNHPKVKVHVSIAKGEGFGRPLLEASLSGKPMGVSDYSGPKDFLNPEYITFLPGELTEIHPSATDDKFLIPGSKWFTADYGTVIGWMKDVEKNYKKYLELSRKQPKYTKDRFTWDKMGSLLKEYLDPLIEKIPTHQEIILPSYP